MKKQFNRMRQLANQTVGSIASWKQVFALNVLEATEPQSLSEESSSVPSSGLLRGPGQVLGLVGLAELNLPPAVFVLGLCLYEVLDLFPGWVC
ncbi:hypothetical protein PAL_GLEAN10008564 [Pteropus alecto]|uniref:Uncharacterized protein n=1 Tax=Pteropus alecto TaxID=9402 RepID=L5KW65_PTEAL|nr:hypothetical protein PAL_GLEAN10008564 [Pteropus alecto]